MKSDLAKKLLKDIIEPICADEAEAEEIFDELLFLADYKYDYYEMYSPGRHFLEHLYIWLRQFDTEDRSTALKYVRNNLVFFSRNEFELLARVLYWDIVRKIQMDVAAQDSGIPRYKVHKLAKSDELRNVERSSLYIGMSDGARIDYFRRQHPSIGNEQVLASYHVDQDKCKDMKTNLEKDCGETRFRLVFLIDDFCASGTTLIREKDGKLKGTLNQLEKKTFPYLVSNNGHDEIVSPCLPDYLLTADSKIYLCPLLATQQAVDNIEKNVHKLSSIFNGLKVMPVSVIDDDLRLTDKTSPIGMLCAKYYQDRMKDEHTGDVTYGYKDCGLPIVLHHNTPNNSLYILWNRRAEKAINGESSFEPLFKRIERHKSNKN